MMKIPNKPENSMWTDDQWKAICLSGNNIIISAGAGSGKTAVLTERILQKLLNGTLINQMIILTFTKAAATGMREKIRKKLKKAVVDHPELKDQLYLIDQADITTFDSYALSLVKKYHYILGIPKNIGIIDNVQLDIETKKVLDEIIENKYDDENFLKVLDIYTNKDDQPFKDVILSIYKKIDSICKKKEYLETYIEEYFKEEKIENNIKDYYNIMEQTKDVILMLLESIKITATEDKYIKYAEKIEEGLSGLNYVKNYSDYKKTLETFSFPRMPNLKDADPIEKDALNGYKNKIKGYLSELSELIKYESIDELKNSILSTKDTQKVIIDILLELDNKMSNFKKSINSYEFSDITRLAIQLLEDNEEIRNDIKYFTNEIMIDEYQDTNDIGDYLVSLISNNNVYMVGDVKQSIYRFRNANPKLFMSKYNDYQDGINGYAIDLTKNFRSRKEVLSGINDMFSMIMDDSIGGADYLNGHIAEFGNKAYEEEGITNQNYELEIYNYDYKNFEEKNKYSQDEIEAFIIADDILKRIKNKEQIFDKDAKTFSDMTFKDIVILVDRKSKFEIFKKIFDYKKIPLIIHKDEEFVYSNEIYVLKNLLKLINMIKTNNYDNFNYSFISVARSYIFDFNDNDIFSSVTNKDMFTNPIFEDLMNQLKELANYSKTTSLSNLIIEIYKKFDFYQKSINIGNVCNVTNKLDHIINVCKTLEETGYSLDDFVIYFDEVFNKNMDIQFSNKQDTSSNSVNIMTIHKSKGLEYSYCYFPHFHNKFNKSDLNSKFLFDQNLGILVPVYNDGLDATFYKKLMSFNYINEDISERLRVLYVALTRAKEKMIIVSPINSIEDNSLPRNADNVVNILERQKYKCFQDILVSLKPEMKKYVVNKEINVTKAYLQGKTANYKKELKTNNTIFETSLLSIEKKKIEEKKYSVGTKKIEKNDKMNSGTKIHEVLEYLDFNTKNIDSYELNDFIKFKIKKLLEKDFIKKGIRFFKEYEFYYQETHGIIDLLVETKDEFIVVDYKLKNIEPVYYEEQVKGYCEYIRTLTNKPVKGILYSIIDEIEKNI